MTCAIYARVSKDEQHTENQLPELHEHARRNGWEVVEYLEEASGKENGRRPVLAQLLKDAQAKKFGVVMVWKIDRFGRSLKEFVNNVNLLESVDVRFVASTQGIDTDKRNPMAKMMMYLLALFAEFERNVLIDRVNAGLQQYRRSYAAGKIGPEGRQSKSKKNLPCGRPKKVFRRDLAFEMRQRGMSWRAIARELGVPPPTVRLAMKDYR